MSKFADKFRKNKDDYEGYSGKTDTYDRKKRDKTRDNVKQARMYDSSDSEWSFDGRKYRK